jgi:uncharacterized alpha-E superfamily protein
MLSRTADPLFWMARCMERAARARRARGEARTLRRASARGGVLGLLENANAV